MWQQHSRFWLHYFSKWNSTMYLGSFSELSKAEERQLKMEKPKKREEEATDRDRWKWNGRWRYEEVIKVKGQQQKAGVNTKQTTGEGKPVQVLVYSHAFSTLLCLECWHWVCHGHVCLSAFSPSYSNMLLSFSVSGLLFSLLPLCQTDLFTTTPISQPNTSKCESHD